MINRHLFQILSVSSDAKTRKGEKFGYLTGIIYLTPSDKSGVINVCPHASPGCRASCLSLAGMGKFPNVIKARQSKTEWFASDRKGFLEQLNKEINILKAIAQNEGLKVAVRFNGTADLPVENFNIIQKHSDIQWYDYTKGYKRMIRYLEGKMPTNYHLTFSRSEVNEIECGKVLSKGGNVAIVFENELPKFYHGYKVICGDESDTRFLDKKNVVVGLTAKGPAKKDHSGFVVRS